MTSQDFVDYYQILQVQPNAEREVVEAAYRRLMRKYHPDVLNPAQRGNPEMQQRIRRINEAYDVLGDPEKRAQYDKVYRVWQTQGPGSSSSKIELEKRVCAARCSRTRKEFDVLMARPKGIELAFRVLGITPPRQTFERQGAFRRFVNWLFRRKKHVETEQREGFPSDSEIEALFGESLALDFGDIDWAGHKCPACGREYIHHDGMPSTWGACGKCGGLYCVGGIRKAGKVGIVTCPWCNTERRVTHHVRSGIKSKTLVRGANMPGQASLSEGPAPLDDGDVRQALPAKSQSE